jgi:hypothetical protein
VDGLVPAAENRDLGPAPVTEGPVLHMKAAVSVQILGEAQVLPAAAGRTVLPPQAHLHRVDLVAVTLLSLLRDRPGPAPDVAQPAGLDSVQGAQPQGAASAAQGSRKAHLYWTALEPGEATVVARNAQGLRAWAIPLTAACTFRLSPAELSGGRILEITQAQETNGNHRQVAIYAPAEAIPLDHFSGLSQPVLTELGAADISTLGHLGRLGVARIGQIAAALRTASAAERNRLSELAATAVLRQTNGANLSAVPVEPEVMALPGRALLAPTPAEAAILARLVGSPGTSDLVTLLAVPVAFALKTDRRETVKVGTLLNGGR